MIIKTVTASIEHYSTDFAYVISLKLHNTLKVPILQMRTLDLFHLNACEHCVME